MEPPYYWMHGFGFMWIFPILFLIILILFLFRGPAWFWPGHERGERRETPREILDRRYASGEIAKEQYEEMKRTLDR